MAAPRKKRGATLARRRVGTCVAYDGLSKSDGHVTLVRLEVVVDGERALVECVTAADIREILDVRDVSLGDYVRALAIQAAIAAKLDRGSREGRPST
jgi:hypothetical protein